MVVLIEGIDSIYFLGYKRLLGVVRVGYLVGGGWVFFVFLVIFIRTYL